MRITHLTVFFSYGHLGIRYYNSCNLLQAKKYTRTQSKIIIRKKDRQYPKIERALKKIVAASRIYI